MENLSERRLSEPGKRVGGLPPATPLSGAPGAGRGGAAGFGGVGVGGALAWTSLLAGLAMISSGCLVTSVPDYQEPKQTPPVLNAATADPPVTQLLELKADPQYPSPSFRVEVRSEDAGEKVQFKFYYDYGIGTPPEAPFSLPPDLAGQLEPSTLADTSREPLTRKWNPPYKFLSKICHHTLTLIASHAFDNAETSCPEDISDSSQLTWHFVVCNGAQPCADEIPPEDCPKQETWTNRCPDKPGESAAAGAGTQ